MNEKDPYKNRIELLQGTLDMLILQTLQWGPQHGYGIVQALRLRSGDVLQVETGSLYPRGTERHPKSLENRVPYRRAYRRGRDS
jgi:hypothetical protein